MDATPSGRAPDPDAPLPAPADEDGELVAGLRRGDEAAFEALVTRYHGALVRVARGRLGSEALAEDVVQETWLAAYQSIGQFEGRSPFRGWLFGILVNRARSRLQREARTVPFSALDRGDDGGPSVEPERFRQGHPRWSGGWASPPQAFPEDRLHTAQALGVVQTTLEVLPASQREVMFLRDVEGWSSEEVCQALGLSEGNQRVLLHRARSRVRAALELHFAEVA